MGNSLRDKTVVVVGRGTGIARAVALLAQSEGARVVVAGRDKAKLESAYGGDITAELIDITDGGSIAALADRLGAVDHVVSTASARARGKLGDLERQKLQLSFDTKVIGPTMLAKYFAPQMKPGGSFVLFSGVHAFKLNVGYLGVGITNGAVDFLARWLAVELAPTRVNAISLRSARHRSLGLARQRRQAGLLHAHRRQQPGAAHRNPGRHRRRRPVRDDQHVHDWYDIEGGRRRTAGLS